MKVAAVIQARMGSSRFPGKVMHPLAGKPVLWHLLARLRCSRHVTDICVATSTGTCDDAIADFGASERVMVVRGAEDDVLDRFKMAVDLLNPDILVRITGDAPLVDPDFIDLTIDTLLEAGADMALVPPGIPCIHEGIDVVSRRAFDQIVALGGNDVVAREHVTAFVKHNPSHFLFCSLDVPEQHRLSGVRLSIDTPVDLSFLEILHRRLGVEAGAIDVADVVALLKAEPWIAGINAHVRQKTATEASRKVLIRCDGGARIGMGHVSRCIELANALRDCESIGVVFAINDDQAVTSALVAQNFPFVVWQQPEGRWLARCIADIGADAVVVDIRGDLSAEALRDAAGGRPLVVIDDASPRRLVADLAVYPPVPQVFDIDWSAFKGELRHGWDWVLGRFRRVESGGVAGNRLLIVMGGADPQEFSAPLARAVAAALPDLPLTVALGPAVPKTAASAALMNSAGSGLSVHENCRDLLPLMADCCAAVTAFGVTAYELAFNGIPMILLHRNDDDERSAAVFVESRLALGSFPADQSSMPDILRAISSLIGDRGRLKEMAAAGPSLIDGQGVSRLSSWIANRLSSDASMSANLKAV